MRKYNQDDSFASRLKRLPLLHDDDATTTTTGTTTTTTTTTNTTHKRNKGRPSKTIVACAAQGADREQTCRSRRSHSSQFLYSLCRCHLNSRNTVRNQVELKSLVNTSAQIHPKQKMTLPGRTFTTGADVLDPERAAHVAEAAPERPWQGLRVPRLSDTRHHMWGFPKLGVPYWGPY